LIQVKDRFPRFPVWLAKSPDRGLQGGNDGVFGQVAVAVNWSRCSSLLVGAGYVAVALAYYFMFNHASLQI